MYKLIHPFREIFASPLSRQYLSWVFFFGTFLSVIITTTEIYSYYSELRTELKGSLERTSSTYLSALRNSLWEHHSAQVQLIIDGITLDSRIKAVEIQGDLLSLSSGVIPENGSSTIIKKPVFQVSAGKNHYIGEFVIYADDEWLSRQVYYFAIMRLLNNVTKSIIIILFSFFAFRILVNRHLNVISRFVSSGKTLKLPGKKLKIDRNAFAYKGRDEIDEVVSAVNQLGNELQVHISELVTMTREAEVVNLRLLEAMRMESLGKQASSITHEFNNSLAIISGAIELISATDELPLEVRKRLEVAESSVHTASELTKQLLQYSSKKTISFSLVRMDGFAKELEEILNILINKKNNLVVLNATRETILINKEMLLSSIINLVKNSNEALSFGGEITVIINDFSKKDKVRDNLEIDKSYLAINIIDNGPGIPERLRGKLFEPFVTTKSDQGGVGLGLWTVSNFIEQISGMVTYQEAEGGGSHFRLILPVDQDVDSKQSYPFSPLSDDFLEGKTILLMESDADFGELLHMFLTSNGGQLQITSSVQEAYEVLGAISQCDVLILNSELAGGMVVQILQMAKEMHPSEPLAKLPFQGNFSVERRKKRSAGGFFKRQ